MSKVKEKVIFFGHASKDKNVVQTFVNHLLDEADLKRRGYKLIYTDTANLDNRLPGGARTWHEILEGIKAAVYFVAFLSESFFESQWCIAELAIFQQIKARAPTLSEPVPLNIDGDSTRTIRDCALTQTLNILDTSIEGLKRLVAGLASQSIPHKSTVDYGLFKNEIDVAIRERDKRKQGEFFELAKYHFLKPRTSDNPVSFFVERHEYEQTAINMGMAAQEKLLWTVFQSPLLVVDAYDYPGLLMPYDLAFESFSARRRIRLVIFRSGEEADAYDSIREDWHNNALNSSGIAKTLNSVQLAQRKSAFELSAAKNGAELLFTEVSRLLKCTTAVPPPVYDEKSFLEFACCDYGEQGAPLLLMETGFSSPFSLAHGSGTANPAAPEYGHVTFYRELTADAQKRIKAVKPYDAFYGHLGELLQIANSVFKANLDPAVFVRSTEIAKLYR